MSRTINNAIFENAIRWTWVPTCQQAGQHKMNMGLFNTAFIQEKLTKKFRFTVLKPQPEIYTNGTNPRHARIGCPITLGASARDKNPAVRAMGLEGYLQSWTLAVHRFDVRGVLHAVEAHILKKLRL